MSDRDFEEALRRSMEESVPPDKDLERALKESAAASSAPSKASLPDWIRAGEKVDYLHHKGAATWRQCKVIHIYGWGGISLEWSPGGGTIMPPFDLEHFAPLGTHTSPKEKKKEDEPMAPAVSSSSSSSRCHPLPDWLYKGATVEHRASTFSVWECVKVDHLNTEQWSGRPWIGYIGLQSKPPGFLKAYFPECWAPLGTHTSKPAASAAAAASSSSSSSMEWRDKPSKKRKAEQPLEKPSNVTKELKNALELAEKDLTEAKKRASAEDVSKHETRVAELAKLVKASEEKDGIPGEEESFRVTQLRRMVKDATERFDNSVAGETYGSFISRDKAEKKLKDLEEKLRVELLKPPPSKKQKKEPRKDTFAYGDDLNGGKVPYRVCAEFFREQKKKLVNLTKPHYRASSWKQTSDDDRKAVMREFVVDYTWNKKEREWVLRSAEPAVAAASAAAASSSSSAPRDRFGNPICDKHPLSPSYGCAGCMGESPEPLHLPAPALAPPPPPIEKKVELGVGDIVSYSDHGGQCFGEIKSFIASSHMAIVERLGGGVDCKVVDLLMLVKKAPAPVVARAPPSAVLPASATLECVICLDKPRNHMAKPCNDAKFCEDCVKELKNRATTRCPFCNQPVTSFEKVFF